MVRDRLVDVRSLAATIDAFAAVRGDGRVVTWGDGTHGGDSVTVSDQLREVKDVKASLAAFAAIRADGRVITWGHVDFGGDCSKAWPPDSLLACLVSGLAQVGGRCLYPR